MMALAIGYGFVRRRPGAVAAVPLPSSALERTTRLYESARAPISLPKDLPRACRGGWQAVRSLDLAELVEYPPRPHLIPEMKSCTPPTPELERAQTDFTNACTALTRWDSRKSQKEWRRATRPCSSALIGYRAAITNYLTRGRQLAAIQDPLVLTDMLIANLGDDRGEGIAVAERLLQVEPQMYPAAKAVLASLLDDAATRAAARAAPDDPIWDKIDQAIRRAEAMPGAERRQLLETELAVIWMRYRDPQRARQKAQALMYTHPEWGVGPYYLAWAEYQAGDREQARTDLAEAIRREPNEHHFREAWEKMEQTGEPPFRTYLSFGFDSH